MERLCSFHWILFADDDLPHPDDLDSYYHRKVMEGLIDPSFAHSGSENTALTVGRPRGDGRRLDDWTVM